MHRMVFILLLAFITAACSSGSDPIADGDPAGTTTPILINGSISRTSGVAPLGVFFNAAIDTSDDGFHSLDYAWDFGDTGSGAWAGTGSSKNSDKGPVAAHIYETPGIYTATLTVSDGNGPVGQAQFSITVTDPDTVYAGTDTICLSDNDDFSGCPDGADQMTSDDILAMEQLVASGKRILLRRGATWTTSGSVYYDNIDGPVTIGAFGPCDTPDERGICDNAPRIHLTGDDEGGIFSLGRTSDWRLQDLYITGETTRWGAVGGAIDMHTMLFMRLRMAGFNTPLGNSHWDTDGHDQMMVVDCDISDSQSNIVYIGSERLVLMGNHLRNPAESHVLRVWQAYLGVISHNDLSGASLYNTAGRHALKFHGPSQEVLANAGNGEEGLVHPSRFVVIADNMFGTSGPWPVCVGPQDSLHDERVQDVIIEKNRFFAGYGDQSATPVQVSLNLWARDITVRNNIFDSTDSSRYYTAVSVGHRGIEPTPSGISIYNNTVYKTDTSDAYTSYVGFRIDEAATDTVIMNNLVQLPLSGSEVALIDDRSSDLTEGNNLLTETPGFIDPDNIDWWLKDFSLSGDSPGFNTGTSVPVWDDFKGTPRPQGMYDLGALEVN